jgi:hypothetical protein
MPNVQAGTQLVYSISMMFTVIVILPIIHLSSRLSPMLLASTLGLHPCKIHPSSLSNTVPHASTLSSTVVNGLNFGMS